MIYICYKKTKCLLLSGRQSSKPIPKRRARFHPELLVNDIDIALCHRGVACVVSNSICYDKLHARYMIEFNRNWVFSKMWMIGLYCVLFFWLFILKNAEIKLMKNNARLIETALRPRIIRLPEANRLTSTHFSQVYTTTTNSCADLITTRYDSPINAHLVQNYSLGHHTYTVKRAAQNRQMRNMCDRRRLAQCTLY